METAQVGKILAKQNLQSFQNPKDERRLVQKIGRVVAYSNCMQFFVQVFSLNNSETNFSNYIKNIKDWQAESRLSKPLHLGFMEFDLYFLTRILFSNNVHHKQHRSHTVRNHASLLCKFATCDLFKPYFQIQVLPESHETFLNVNKPTGYGRIVNYNLNMSLQFVHNMCRSMCFRTFRPTM